MRPTARTEPSWIAHLTKTEAERLAAQSSLVAEPSPYVRVYRTADGNGLMVAHTSGRTKRGELWESPHDLLRWLQESGRKQERRFAFGDFIKGRIGPHAVRSAVERVRSAAGLSEDSDLGLYSCAAIERRLGAKHLDPALVGDACIFLTEVVRRETNAKWHFGTVDQGSGTEPVLQVHGGGLEVPSDLVRSAFVETGKLKLFQPCFFALMHGHSLYRDHFERIAKVVKGSRADAGDMPAGEGVVATAASRFLWRRFNLTPPRAYSLEALGELQFALDGIAGAMVEHADEIASFAARVVVKGRGKAGPAAENCNSEEAIWECLHSGLLSRRIGDIFAARVALSGAAVSE
jgi:hypothetical protein